jgi:methionine-rich copper-binding protein CopC
MKRPRPHLAPVVAALLLAGTATLAAHLKVEKTSPAADATITTQPQQVRVLFSQAPTLAISSLALEGPNGKVALGKVAAGQTDGRADHSLVATVPDQLPPGAYTVTWRTSGPDGHIQTGTFAFTLAAGR